MSKRRRNITAEELMKRLNSDQEYLERKARKDAEIEALDEECRLDERILVSELNKLGLQVDSVWDLVNNAPHEGFCGSYEVAYPLLVEHLGRKHHCRIREGIIRALTEKNAKDIAMVPLLKELEVESVQSHRWVISNALVTMLTKRELERYPEIEEVYRAGYL